MSRNLDTFILIANRFEAGLPLKSSFSSMLDGRTITRQIILALKRRALRRRIWTVALNRLERGMLDVTIQSVDRVKSKRLAQVLMRILAKLTEALDHRLFDALKKGRDMADTASRIASSWGHLEASKWRRDSTFHIALGNGVLFGN